MEMTNDMWVLAMFYVEIPKGPAYPKGGNLNGLVYRPTSSEEGPWFVEYRFRRYVDTKAIGSADEKFSRKVQVGGNPTGEHVAGSVRAAVLKFSGLEEGMEMDWIELKAPAIEAFERLAKNPPKWMHITKARKTH